MADASARGFAIVTIFFEAMSKTKYFYNPKTLRYERIKLSIVNVVFTVLGYASFGALFFVALVFAENYFFETELEKSLRKENASLTFYKSVLKEELTGSTQALSSLQEKESALYTKLFETNKVDAAVPKIHREEILTSDESNFSDWIASIDTRFHELHTKAQISNYRFASSTHIDKKELPELFNTPSVAPVEGFQIEQLVSGFGTRINPFHKGLYQHDGIDIAGPTGSAVIASGNGKVIAASNSSMVGGYGNYVEIDHGQGLVTRYAHLGELSVRVGQKIIKGQLIGKMGISGGSVAPHVHYEVLKDGKSINPNKFIIAGLSSSQYDELLVKSNNQNQSLD